VQNKWPTTHVEIARLTPQPDVVAKLFSEPGDADVRCYLDLVALG
jgi:hypothetical protein